MTIHQIATATNNSEFYLWALYEIASQQVSDRFRNLNTLLQFLSPSSPQITLETMDEFFEKNGTLALAIHNGVIVGICGLVTVTKFNGTTGRIEQMVVHPDHRGNKLSRKMMEALITTARDKKLRYLDLTSDPSREEANHLYARLGFTLRSTNPYRLQLDL